MAKKKRAGRGSARRGASGGALRGVSTMELRAELERRSRDLDKLEARRDELTAQLEQVEAEISTISSAIGAAGRAGRGRGARRGRPAGASGAGRRGGRRAARAGGGKRPRNAESLEVALAKVLKGKTMGVSEVADAVQKAGYKTSSPNFRTIVNQALLRSELIKKTGRGAYTAA
ncbi:MAG TPA: hypothetical protein VFF69_03580 [Phycisphaerales bacterium]|nr:hypothetical protein [Phycisphaerales bacterium]